MNDQLRCLWTASGGQDTSWVSSLGGFVVVDCIVISCLRTEMVGACS